MKVEYKYIGTKHKLASQYLPDTCIIGLSLMCWSGQGRIKGLTKSLGCTMRKEQLRVAVTVIKLISVFGQFNDQQVSNLMRETRLSSVWALHAANSLYAALLCLILFCSHKQHAPHHDHFGHTPTLTNSNLQADLSIIKNSHKLFNDYIKFSQKVTWKEGKGLWSVLHVFYNLNHKQVIISSLNINSVGWKCI